MATIKIRNRWTDAVIFECEAPEGLESGLHMRHAVEAAVKSGANLSGANLSGADLSDADLRGANLRGADLRGAYLSDAKWPDGVTINRAPLQIFGLRWPISILDEHMQIGCQLHTLAAWADFDDAAIAAMDGRDALRFWRAHKAGLLAMAAADGRGVAVAAAVPEVA